MPSSDAYILFEREKSILKNVFPSYSLEFQDKDALVYIFNGLPDRKHTKMKTLAKELLSKGIYVSIHVHYLQFGSNNVLNMSPHDKKGVNIIIKDDFYRCETSEFHSSEGKGPSPNHQQGETGEDGHVKGQ